MPGLSDTTARALVAEIDTDMTRFPAVGHLVSWAGLCLRLDESAGKRRSTRARRSAPWLKTTLLNAAWAATRKKDSHRRAQFLRLEARCGAKKAILAVAGSMLTAVYHMLRDGVEYHDLGPRYFLERARNTSRNDSCNACVTSASPSRSRPHEPDPLPHPNGSLSRWQRDQVVEHERGQPRSQLYLAERGAQSNATGLVRKTPAAAITDRSDSRAGRIDSPVSTWK